MAVRPSNLAGSGEQGSVLEDGQQEGSSAVADDKAPVQLEPRFGLDGRAKYVAAAF